jgi:hypothetical protein
VSSVRYELSSYVPEDGTFQNYRHENLELYMTVKCFNVNFHQIFLLRPFLGRLCPP